MVFYNETVYVGLCVRFVEMDSIIPSEPHDIFTQVNIDCIWTTVK